MSSSRTVFVLPMDRLDDAVEVASPECSTIKSLGLPVRRAIHRTRQWLLTQQQADGAWCAELEGDTILESETGIWPAAVPRTWSRSSCPTVAGRCTPAAESISAAA